jgi:hypothetical protein
MCYECFDKEIRRIFASHAEQQVREHVREIDRRYLKRGLHHPHPAAGV